MTTARHVGAGVPSRGYTPAIAQAQGWILAEHDDGTLEIQRYQDDPQDRFPTDAAALAFVVAMANSGDQHALTTFRIINENRPGPRCLIVHDHGQGDCDDGTGTRLNHANGLGASIKAIISIAQSLIPGDLDSGDVTHASALLYASRLLAIAADLRTTIDDEEMA